MALSRSRSRLCPGCAQGQALINRLEGELDAAASPAPEAVIETLPLLMETALSHLLAEFDYPAHPHSRTAQAIRLIAVGADRAQELLDRHRARRG